MRGWRAQILLGLVLLACPELGLLAEDQRAFLDLVINLAPKGTILVFLEPGDVWVRVADLEEAGLHDFFGRQQAIAGETYVSLASLATACLAPAAFWFFSYPAPLVGLSLLMALGIVLRHRENIRRLALGVEPKFEL